MHRKVSSLLNKNQFRDYDTQNLCLYINIVKQVKPSLQPTTIHPLTHPEYIPLNITSERQIIPDLESARQKILKSIWSHQKSMDSSDHPVLLTFYRFESTQGGRTTKTVIQIETYKVIKDPTYKYNIYNTADIAQTTSICHDSRFKLPTTRPKNYVFYNFKNCIKNKLISSTAYNTNFKEVPTYTANEGQHHLQYYFDQNLLSLVK